MSASKVPPRLVLGSWREVGTVATVAALSGAYAAVLLMVADITARASGDFDSARPVLRMVAFCFIVIALYVAGVVMTNAISTVLAGRLRALALLRLLGADGDRLRRQIVRHGSLVALCWSTIGTVLGCAVVAAVRMVLVARGKVPDISYPLASGTLPLTVLVIVLVTATACRLGSRAVLAVTPADAFRGPREEAATGKRIRRLTIAAALVLVGFGALLLIEAALLGESRTESDQGVLVALFGAIATSTGILVGARFFLPAAVTAFGRLLGASTPVLIARRNAVKDPGRTTRSTIGLAIGVCLVVTFSSGLAVFRAHLDVLTDGSTAHQRMLLRQTLDIVELVLIAIVLISAVIAAVGFASTMSLSVLQRTREIGLLRVLGLTGQQVRQMISAEATAMLAAALLLGTGLGVVYGSVAAQVLAGGSLHGFTIGTPWFVLALVAVAGSALVFASSRVPARRAVAVDPIEALRIS